jgi:rhodanese-related sulfurtransferase
VHLVDVRSPSEFADGYVEGSVSLPLDQLDVARLQRRVADPKLKQTPVYLICASGVRSEQAYRQLAEQGLEQIAVVTGGTQAWRSERLPMGKTGSGWSLERQTQVALGVMLLAVLAKGLLLHPVFLALIGAVALGLIWAGVSARCSLTALIARMPWNQRQAGNAPANG